MIRAGVVDHPAKWPNGGYNEIQSPRRKNIIIAYDRLRELSGFKDYDTFTTAHRKWVQGSLEKIESKRDRRWTQSLAVGSKQFTEHIRTKMGVMARGRRVRQTSGAFELREAQTDYN